MKTIKSIKEQISANKQLACFKKEQINSVIDLIDTIYINRFLYKSVRNIKIEDFSDTGTPNVYSIQVIFSGVEENKKLNLHFYQGINGGDLILKFDSKKEKSFVIDFAGNVRYTRSLLEIMEVIVGKLELD